MGSDSLYIYRASELGSCDKALIAKRMGYEKDESVYRKGSAISTIFREGDLHETAVVEKYREELGHEITLQQHEINIPIMQGVIVQGHLDGVIKLNHPELNSAMNRFLNGYVLEIKSMGADPFKEFKKHRMDTPGLIQKYKWQFSAYMIAMERPLLLVVKNRNTGEIIEVQIDEPYYSLADIRLRILRLEAASRSGELPVNCVNPQYPCPFYYLHEDDNVQFVTDEVVDSYVRVYSIAKAEENAAKSRAAEARNRLATLSKDNPKLETPKSKITTYSKKSKRVDWEKIYADYGITDEVVAKYTEETSSQVMRITDKEEARKKKEEKEMIEGKGVQLGLLDTTNE